VIVLRYDRQESRMRKEKMTKQIVISRSADGIARALSPNEPPEASTPMSLDDCETMLDRLIEATNYVAGGGLEGYKWAIGQLVRQMEADHGVRGAVVMHDLGWLPMRKFDED
jgi:hypothetical protein